MGWMSEIKATYRLAIPVMGVRFAGLILFTSDIIMTGWAGGAELAYFGAAFAPSQLIYMICLGWMSGLSPYVARLRGGRQHDLCGSAWRAAMGHMLGLGLLAVLISSNGVSILEAFNQPSPIAQQGGQVMVMLGWGLPGGFLLLTCGGLLEGLRKPQLVLYVMLGGNVLNLLLNALLIFPHGDWAGMGALGAALATSIVRWGMGLTLLGLVWWLPERTTYDIRGTRKSAWLTEREVRLQGIPLGTAQFFEASAFAMLNLMAGRLGATSLAAYQIAQNLFTIVYMLGVGMGVAASVRVGEALGAHQPQAAKRAAGGAVVSVLLVLLPLAVVFFAWPGVLAGLYTQTPAVASIARVLLHACALFIIFDALQGVWMGTLRGMGDVHLPASIVTLGFWGISVPLAWWFGFQQALGVGVFAWALAAGAILAAAGLWGRFYVTLRRKIAGSLPTV